MLTVLLLSFALYGVLMVLLSIGWRRATVTHAMRAPIDPKPYVSVIIAARNEEDQIAGILQDLKDQTYEAFEVIIVNDHSQDATATVVSNIIHGNRRFSLLRAEGCGKKSAIARGVEAARGSIILTTDADCRINVGWIEGMIHFFQMNSTVMVFGGVSMNGPTFFETLQSVEFASLIGVGAATAGLGHATLCNGANLAYRKSAFEEVSGYEGNLDVPSGDDEFLMRKLQVKHPNGVRFAADPKTVVKTTPNKDLNQFVQQRIRWAGKWSRAEPISILLALFVFCFQLIMLALPLFAIVGIIDPVTAAFLYSCKIAAEFLFLRTIIRFLTLRWNWKAFFFLQFVYPFYTVAIAVLCNFRTYRWKGRKLNALTVSSN
jgi:biofilm PGA synthesis N-glycosyltransferase PgaC